MILRFLLLLSLCYGSFSLKAQVQDTFPWCPPGAHWVYTTLGLGSQGYDYDFTYIGDSLIGQDSVKIIRRKTYGWIYAYYYYRLWSVHHEYYRYANDSVFQWNDRLQRFELRYVFNLQPGDAWQIQCDTIEWNYWRAFYDSPARETDWLHIRSQDTSLINGRFYITYNIDSTYDWTMGQEIINNIGAIGAWYPQLIYNPDTNMVCGAPPDSWFLSCYRDDLRGDVYGFGSNPQACDLSLRISTEKLPNAHAVQLLPNPVRDQVQLQCQGQTLEQVQILTIDGRVQLLSQEELACGQSLHLGHLPSGLYLLRYWQGDQGWQSLRLVKE